MSEQKKHTDPEVKIEQAIYNSEGFIIRNAKKLLTLLMIVALVVCGYFGYQAFVVEPRTEQATNEIFTAQEYFATDSLALALNGIEGVFMGFEAIANQFSGTPQGNIANHYAGICHMGLGDFKAALQSLTAFSQFSNSDAAGQILNAQNLGLQGDCQSQLGNLDQAQALYAKAAAASQSDATTPLYLQKQAITLYTQGKMQAALSLFQQIKEQHPSSLQSRDADKHIALIKQKI